MEKEDEENNTLDENTGSAAAYVSVRKANRYLVPGRLSMSSITSAHLVETRDPILGSKDPFTCLHIFNISCFLSNRFNSI